MSNEPSIVAIIPARGGSKGIPRKNIRLLNGRPLIYYAIQEAKKSKYLGRLIVSTEDNEIAEAAKKYGAEVVERPVELAQDDTPSILVYQQVIGYLKDSENLSPDVIVILQPTSSCRIVADIDGAIEKYLGVDCDTVVSVCEAEHLPQWMYTLDGDRLSPVIEGGERVTIRQDAPKTYRLNGAVYVIHRDVVMVQNRIIGNDTRPFVMPLERSVDIDTCLDFKLAEVLMKDNENSKDS